MALVTYTIPNLINGISQQAPQLRRKTQAALMDNGWASVVDGLQKRPPIENVAKVLTSTDYSESHVHAMNRDVTERYVAVFGPTEITVFGVDGSLYQVETPDGVGYLPASPSSQMRCVTFDDYTFVVNTEMTMAMSGTTPTAPNSQGFVEVRAANYEMDYTLTVTDADGAYAVTLTTGGGPPYNTTDQIAGDLASSTTLDPITDFEDPTRAATVDGSTPGTAAADAGLQDLLTAEATDTYVVTRDGNVIHIENTSGNDFQIDVKDGNADAAMLASKDSVEFFTELPTRAVHDVSIEVTSTPEGGDAYWVKFERPDAASGIGEGQWIESVDPSIDNAFDPSTMPHVLVRRFDDGSGTITGTPNAAYFSFEEWTWSDRGTGDADSNPEPSLIGAKARDIFFFRDRLGILTASDIVLSESGFYENFFRTTVTVLVDSDVLDLAISDNQAAELYWAVPDEQDLILFSDQTQYILESNGPLTPGSASIRATTRFESNRRARPQLIGDRVIFGQENGSYVGLREYRLDANTQKRTAEEITGHVDQYIEGDLKDMTASAQQRALVVATSGSQYVYLYQWFDQGPQRLQAAWSRWDLGVGDYLLGLRFIDTSLYFVSQRGDGVYLEKIETDPGRQDYDSGVVIHLDRRVDLNDVPRIYDPVADETTITLPYPCDDVPLIVPASNECPDSCGDPDFAGTYYGIERCTDGVEPPVYVQDDEFNLNDVFLRNGVCYKVVTTTETDPPLTSVLRVADVTSSADCATCTSTWQDPDVMAPPMAGTSFLRMARCEDDSMGEYSITEQIMGFPAGDDLTKIYELNDVCYYVTNVRETAPSDPLFPVMMATAHDTCIDCIAPCTNCSNDPSDLVASGLIDNDVGNICTSANTTFTFIDKDTTPTRCVWNWRYYDAVNARTHEVWLYYALDSITVSTAGNCPGIPLVKGEWLIKAELDYPISNGVDYVEKTTGFSCNTTTGKISGSHEALPACNAGGKCDDSITGPTFTVAP
jgi:hypothetical protein